MARRRTTKPQRVGENPKTTINLPPDLKRKAKLHALETGRDLQDLIAEGLRLVLAREGVR
jgi:hypothetical protein